MCGHDVFEGSLWLPGFESKTQVTLPKVLFSLGSHARPEEPIMHEVKHVLQAQMTNLVMVSSESNLPLCSWQNQLKEDFLWLSGLGLPVYNTLFEQQVVILPPVLTDFGGSVVWDWLFPSILSLSLAITRLRTGSTSWAWCQSSRAIQAVCLLSWIACKICRSQL